MKKTVKDVEVKDKRVLVRVDFNVPLDESGGILSDFRLRATLPTILYLINQKAAVILCSHLGRPDGKVVKGLSLRPVAERLSRLLNRPVKMANDCIGPEVEAMARGLSPGEVLMLENLRFHPGEEANDADFAGKLASLADIYVNDAFGASHRAHASIVGVPKHLPAVAGLLLDREMQTLGGLLKNPAHPFAALFGGAKVSDKVGVIERIINKVDSMLIGGAMAALFLKVRSYGVGKSKVEEDRLDTARDLMKRAEQSGVKVMLPTDVVLAKEIARGTATSVAAIDRIPEDMMIVDIGPETVRSYEKVLSSAKTIFWNGPVGVYEVLEFSQGTRDLANHIASTGAVTITAGGSTAEVADDLGLVDRVTFVSTGGGASLSYLSGETLPGIAVLPDRLGEKVTA